MITAGAKMHHYSVEVRWTGNRGTGTSGYRDYARDHEIGGAGKSAVIPGSSDPVFRGDPARYNPEELLMAALSSCHMLWVLHLCADAGIAVTEYMDAPEGVVVENADGSGRFTEVTLRPRMRITDAARIDGARAIHDRAAPLCAIGASMNFPVRHEPEIRVG